MRRVKTVGLIINKMKITGITLITKQEYEKNKSIIPSRAVVMLLNLWEPHPTGRVLPMVMHFMTVMICHQSSYAIVFLIVREPRLSLPV